MAGRVSVGRHVHLCGTRPLYAPTWRFKTRGINDETFSDVRKQTHDALGQLLGHCKRCDSRWLLVGAIHEPIDSGKQPIDSGRQLAPRQDVGSHHGRSIDNRTVVYASAPACCLATHHRSSANPADDTCTPLDNTYNSSTATTHVCSAARHGQPIYEYAAQSGLLQCLLF